MKKTFLAVVLVSVAATLSSFAVLRSGRARETTTRLSDLCIARAFTVHDRAIAVSGLGIAGYGVSYVMPPDAGILIRQLGGHGGRFTISVNAAPTSTVPFPVGSFTSTYGGGSDPTTFDPPIIVRPGDTLYIAAIVYGYLDFDLNCLAIFAGEV